MVPQVLNVCVRTCRGLSWRGEFSRFTHYLHGQVSLTTFLTTKISQLGGDLLLIISESCAIYLHAKIG